MRLFLVVLLTCLCVACTEKNPQVPANKNSHNSRQETDLLQYNKACLQAETNEISQFIQHHPTYAACDEGWWIQVIKKGDGPAIQPMQPITMLYSVERLDGSICYSSDTDGEKKIIVGKRQWLQGIDLLLPTLTIGSEVNVIFPSRMAYGFRGKDNCIGSYCPILCRIVIQQ